MQFWVSAEPDNELGYGQGFPAKASPQGEGVFFCMFLGLASSFPLDQNFSKGATFSNNFSRYCSLKQLWHFLHQITTPGSFNLGLTCHHPVRGFRTNSTRCLFHEQFASHGISSRGV